VVPFSKLQSSVQMPKPKRYIQEPKTLGDYILNARIDKRFEQKEVAALIGVTENTISNWELNLYKPDIQFYPNIFKFIECIPFELKTDTLGDQIRTFRILNGMSQEKLASELGINESTVFHYEKGKHKPTKKVLAKLSVILDS